MASMGYAGSVGHLWSYCLMAQGGQVQSWPWVLPMAAWVSSGCSEALVLSNSTHHELSLVCRVELVCQGTWQGWACMIVCDARGGDWVWRCGAAALPAVCGVKTIHVVHRDQLGCRPAHLCSVGEGLWGCPGETTHAITMSLQRGRKDRTTVAVLSYTWDCSTCRIERV